ncbi:Trimethyllysine dioxygenase, mitochondrial [Zancudomyces culisetae]|uniref:Trimethyllysine dioxygenase, mitochondrial n=1 Tax=Zancudomyces culisetae TaxID=1213189 RepID=A0A1R1PVS4_ZANCU|nr:Trimethyllysine dioxygenase, mitochondrial [Zancudomyces culisetae]|eukprot:OMH85024.1 Trimethyllysine dioxygenase, mitochondrial [Zancudomyces culisetae]
MTGKIPTVDYEKVMNTDEGLYEWLNNIRIYGLGTVSGVPVTEEATKKTIERIGPIRDTHYGAFWAFTSGFAHGDLAYSTLEIPAHTDTTYFNDPAGLQLFHLLEEAGVGGEQFYVDGFAAAEILKKEDPEAHKILSEARVYGYQAGDENVFLKPTAQPYPLLNYNNKGELYQIRFNNEDRYIINNLKFDMVPKYYNALRKWMEIVRRPESELVLALKPGTLIAIDNWRVMHARKSFKGGRTLSGGYVDTDYWKSKYRVVSFRAKGKDCKAELL